jgi:rhodanese-related sulfurtransferase
MSAPQVPEIDVHELGQKLKSSQSFILLDVREGWELDCALINDSRLKVVPTSRLAQFGVKAFSDEVQRKDAEIFVICHHGVRSASVTEWMRAQGWTNVFSVRGGISEYARVVDGSIGKY